MKWALARATEAGSRTPVHAASAGPETHGKYPRNFQVTEANVFVMSEKGKGVQPQVWDELTEKLEGIEPGVTQNL